MIPYGRQEITQQDIDVVVSVLKSDYLTQGPVVPQFEAALADYCGAAGAVAMNSATSALHVAYNALGLGPGDRLWTSPITFVATANAALYCGAEVSFVDIDPKTYNMSPHCLEEKLQQAERQGRLPKIVVPVHLAGQSCDMSAISKLAIKYGFRVVEDASHGIGGRYRNRPVGSCQFSDIAVFSFHPVKIITTGEGGAAICNDPKLLEHMTLLRSHGITRDPALMSHEPDGPWYYQQIDLGYNYRMTDMQAALGLSQLNRLDHYVARRHEIASHFNDELADLPLICPWQHPDSHSAYHLYVIRIASGAPKARRETFKALQSSDIGVNLHYIPVHLQPFYKKRGFQIGAYPQSESYYEQALSLPMFPGLSERDQTTIIDALTKTLA